MWLIKINHLFGFTCHIEVEIQLVCSCRIGCNTAIDSGHQGLRHCQDPHSLQKNPRPSTLTWTHTLTHSCTHAGFKLCNLYHWCWKTWENGSDNRDHWARPSSHFWASSTCTWLKSISMCVCVWRILHSGVILSSEMTPECNICPSGANTNGGVT